MVQGEEASRAVGAGLKAEAAAATTEEQEPGLEQGLRGGGGADGPG